MENNLEKFIQKNSPDGGFLQSLEWRKFQEGVERKTYNVSGNNFYANVIEHRLPLVGKYFYVPRGPVMSRNTQHATRNTEDLISLAKENRAGWIRIEVATDEILESIKCSMKQTLVKAPHDMQPREIFVLDITKSEEELLADMKPKTRYNVRLAEKKGVSLRIANLREYTNNKDVDEFIRLTKVMAKRNGIVTHSESYYKKMLEVIPKDILKLYIAEYNGKMIAANLVVFYGSTCTYLHGASDDEYRNVMAPYLLQWQQLKDAKKAACLKYDFGGIKTRDTQQATRNNSWSGITKFKLGFSPDTKSIEFPGSYDIVVSPMKYWGYRSMQRGKGFLR